MTRMRKAFSVLVAVSFSTLLALSGLLCLISSFGLEFELKYLVMGCLALSCWFALAMNMKRTGIALLTCLAPVLLLLSGTVRGELMASLGGLGCEIFGQLGHFYPGLDSVAQAMVNLASDRLLWGLLVLAAVMILPCQWAVLGSGPVGPAFGAAILVLAPCLFVVDMLPALGSLLALTGCLCMLALTRSRFSRETRQGAGLTLKLAIPLGLLLVMLAAVFPRDGYVRPQWPDDLRESLSLSLERGVAKVQGQELQEELMPDLDVGYTGILAELEDYDLSALGPRRTTGRRVMDVKAGTGGSIYLRGASFGRYMDNVWSSADQDSYPTSFSAPMTNGDDQGPEAVDIRTVIAQPLMYLPYYPTELPQGGAAMRDVYVGNVDELEEYTTYRSKEPKDGYWNDAYERYVYNEYLQVPEDIAPRLWDVLADSDVLAVNATEAVIQGIVNHVQSLAVYDLNTPAVPEGQDFALWFLESSHRGYCVHFATACCLLMRSAGIPARYVTGYLAQARNGQWSSVTDDRAHAWVECYVSGYGWIPVECTPAAALEQQISSQLQQQEEQMTEQTVPQEQPTSQPEASETVPPESTPEPTQETAPEPQKQDSTTAEDGASHWLWLLLIPGALAVIALRRWLVLELWDRRYARAEPNDRARLIWRRIAAALKILGDEPPADQEDIVLKARFSQHRLTDQELDSLEQLWAGLRARLAKCGPIHSLVYMYVLVMY